MCIKSPRVAPSLISCRKVKHKKQQWRWKQLLCRYEKLENKIFVGYVLFAISRHTAKTSTHLPSSLKKSAPIPQELRYKDERRHAVQKRIPGGVFILYFVSVTDPIRLTVSVGVMTRKKDNRKTSAHIHVYRTNPCFSDVQLNVI